MTQAAARPNTIWLTQEAFDQLQAELERPARPRPRSEIVERISAARDEGDLKENGGYHAARDEQGKIEARIRQLEDMLRARRGRRDPGRRRRRRARHDRDLPLRRRRRRARRSCSAPARSPRTHRRHRRSTPRSRPLGAAIIGAKTGDTVDYEAPNGKDAQGRDRRRGAVHRLTPRRAARRARRRRAARAAGRPRSLRRRW